MALTTAKGELSPTSPAHDSGQNPLLEYPVFVAARAGLESARVINTLGLVWAESRRTEVEIGECYSLSRLTRYRSRRWTNKLFTIYLPINPPFSFPSPPPARLLVSLLESSSLSSVNSPSLT